MDADAVLHRHIRKPLATVALLLIVGCFTLAPFLPRRPRSAWLQPLAQSAARHPRHGVDVAHRPRVSALRLRLQDVPRDEPRRDGAFLATCLIPICASGNPTSAVWVMHFAHVITCGTAGSERRFNLTLFTLLPLPAVAYFAATKGLASAALVAAIAGVTLYAYAVMSATSNRLSITRGNVDELQAQVTALASRKSALASRATCTTASSWTFFELFWQLQSLRATATTPEAEASFDALTHRITQSTDAAQRGVGAACHVTRVARAARAPENPVQRAGR